ncbi:hypothetical protein YTPLAS18_34990 [Nitrospira sp.]|nr:hypothetical protein YTPLAS18_34990 [Nitrospira sp.]
MAILLMSLSVILSGEKETEHILVTFPNGQQLEGEVANTPEKLLFGLAFRETLPTGSALLMIFDESGLHRVWTKEYRIPVDMIWVDESKHIVHVMEGLTPCEKDPCPRYGPPSANARYILQTRAGFVKDAGVAVGMELKFTLVM